MEISKELAQSIVFEMKKIIDKDLNFIDSNGIIIASTDKKRVGSYHAGGIEAIKKDGIVTVDWEEQYEGAKRGINIPIKFLGESIAVIGISGEREEVEKFAVIIKKMAEILIKESYFLRKKDEEEEYERNILETLIYTENFFRIQNKIKDKSRIITLKINYIEERNKIKNIFREIRDKLKDNLNYFLLKDENIITLFVGRGKEELEKELQKLEKIIEKYKIEIGIGEEKKNIEKIKESYRESKIALEWCEKIGAKKIYYEDMVLEIILNSLSLENKEKYKNKVLKNLNFDEMEEYKKIISLYEKYNGSLLKISKEFGCHTNTLQYKLNKFVEKTGYDIRKYRDFVIIRLAFFLKD